MMRQVMKALARIFLLWSSLFTPLLFAPLVQAAPAAHVLRIDPRTSVQDGNPVVTTLIDLTEGKRLSEVLSPCSTLTGNAALDCMSDALERPHSLGTPVPFPEKNVLFTVKIGERDVPTQYLGHSRWGESQNEPDIGTAWLLIIDADAHTGSVLDEFVAVARRFVQSMGPHDLVNVVLINDTQIVSDTRWLQTKQSSVALQILDETTKTFRSPGRTRPLLSLVKQISTDAFRALGNPSENLRAPLHQAIVLLSSGYGGGDPSTTGPGAEQFRQALTRGQFVEGNSALPKTPIPLISIMTPPTGYDEHRQLAREFMQNLANPEIGGFFTVIRDGQADHAARIVDTVRARFSHLVVARFRLSCLAPSTTQSFSLLFPQHEPAIAGDATYQSVPLGFDPSQWPLDLDAEMTRHAIHEQGGVHPGGTVRVYGNFCWGGDLTRPEIYFLPPGEKLPRDVNPQNLEVVQQIQKRLISLNMRGTVLDANESFAEFRIPDSDAVLHGEGESAVMRFVVVDRLLLRSSGLSETTVLQVKARAAPLPWIAIGVGSGLALLSLIGLGLLLKKNNRQRSHAPPSTRSARMEDSPYATPSPVTRVPRSSLPPPQRATLEGPAGRFVILPGADLRVGRDGARCAAVISHPQVSGLHATFRWDEGRVWVRDEGSTSGTRVAGQLIEVGRYLPLEDGVEISLGPETFVLTLSPSS